MRDLGSPLSRTQKDAAEPAAAVAGQIQTDAVLGLGLAGCCISNADGFNVNFIAVGTVHIRYGDSRKIYSDRLKKGPWVA